jgi:hypothetical protein
MAAFNAIALMATNPWSVQQSIYLIKMFDVSLSPFDVPAGNGIVALGGSLPVADRARLIETSDFR